MPNTQDPGIRRSEKHDAVQDSWPSEATSEGPASSGRSGPVPDENLPGHHPEQEQDKPVELGGAGHGRPSD